MGALSLSGGSISGATHTLPIDFEIVMTLVSGLAAWVIAALGIHFVANRDVARRLRLDRDFFVRWALASTFVATGVCVMHYMGMVSQSGPVTMTLGSSMVIVSVIIALIAAHAGLFILIAFPDTLAVRFFSALVIAVAVNGMHYTGMAAAEYRVAEAPRLDISRTAVAIDGGNIAIASLVLDIIVFAVCILYGERLRVKSEEMMKKKVSTAIASLEEFAYPMIVIPSSVFLRLDSTSLLDSMHEGFRNSGALQVFDHPEDLQRAKDKGMFIIFFSYECLRWGSAGPNEVQLEAMQAAVREVAQAHRRELDKVHIWLDCLSIPQRNKSTKLMAINAIYTYARLPNVMVIACPQSRHQNTGHCATDVSLRRRLWCRMEHLAFYAQHGEACMFLHRGSGLEALPSDWMASVCRVFEADCTCCRLQHKTSELCDRETCVLPLLALYYDQRRRHLLGQSSSAASWAMIQQARDEMFPSDFVYIMPDGTKEHRVLFGNMLDRIDRYVTRRTSQSCIEVTDDIAKSRTLVSTITSKESSMDLEEGKVLDVAGTSDADSMN